jgi:hypothetical protein
MDKKLFFFIILAFILLTPLYIIAFNLPFFYYITKAQELCYNKKYEFTCEKNETNYYKIWGNRKTFIIITFYSLDIDYELQQYKIWISLIFDHAIMDGYYSAKRGRNTKEISPFMEGYGWVYFYVYHPSPWENITSKYNISIRYILDVGQQYPP